jgi:hypothetical protein
MEGVARQLSDHYDAVGVASDAVQTLNSPPRPIQTSSSADLSMPSCGGSSAWRMPLTPMRVPVMIDIKSDPYEYSWDASAYWEQWVIDRTYLVLPAVSKVAAYLSPYREFPPRQRPASFSIDQVIEKLQSSTRGK